MSNKVNIISPSDVGFKLFKDVFTGIEWNDNVNSNVYHIDTKYYSCDVNLKTIEISDGSLSNSVKEPCHLIVLLFDQSNEKSFKAIQSIVTKIVEQSDGNESIILMEVSNATEDSSSIKVDNNTIEEWCIENAIELLFLNQIKHRAYESQKDNDEDQRIKYGIDRFKEILETTMWDQMEYKTSNRPTGSLNDDDEDEENQDEDEEDQLEKDIKTINNLASTVAATHISKDEQEYSKFLNESLKSIEHFFGKGIAVPPTTTSTTDAVEEEDMKKLNDEFDQVALFESTLLQLKNVREQMKNLPDDKRRDMAAQVAMMFASKLGGEDGDEDEDFDPTDLD
ncbi:hypothetical protein PPL_01578 [Heterostelium album PN500]|uniref:Alpha-and gamma-adaptin-binding protein p34 n=1 Tax=Heterostelium pallidum (strain ATCC 26659 / Pp 5 / PN500) TaxID=670386 RepID=D3AZW4_HETP5|nr:hypothetical protein PPL_01578 [Heterostelium album PN500]EFA84588.1 hypothetical protein PPL_01578 [Heterostelium album PN500]|eukprot:XP_020436701.1 hypothetical protein PPL_01578 [Heterostelium album PN500]